MTVYLQYVHDIQKYKVYFRDKRKQQKSNNKIFNICSSKQCRLETAKRPFKVFASSSDPDI